MRARQADSAGARELYAEADEFIVQGSALLAQDPGRWTPVLEDMSTAVKANFLDNVRTTERVPKLSETCRDAAMQALQAGLLAGAIDATLMWVLNGDAGLQSSGLVRPAPAETEGLPDREQFEGRLDEILAGAAAGLRDMGPWAVRHASTMARDTGAEAVDQAGTIPDSGLSKPAYQAFLLTCFTTGYSAAGLDATLIVGAGEKP